MTINDHIVVFEIGGKEIKYTAYAGDITCFCKTNKSLLSVFTEFEEFSKRSGLSINKSNTEGMWIGKNRHLGEKKKEVLHGQKREYRFWAFILNMI